MSNPRNILVAYEVIGRDLYLRFADGGIWSVRGTVNVHCPDRVAFNDATAAGMTFGWDPEGHVLAGGNRFTFPGGSILEMRRLDRLGVTLPDEFPLYILDEESGEYAPVIEVVSEDGTLRLIAGSRRDDPLTVDDLPDQGHWPYRMEDGRFVRLFGEAKP